MGPPATSDTGRFSIQSGVLVPALFFVSGVVVSLAGLLQFSLFLRGEGSVLIALLNLFFLAGPGTVLIYTGYWLPSSDIAPKYYYRIIIWVAGGVVVMFGFVLLRDIHPGVSAEWSLGTQAIALMIGTVGGLLIGIEEATVRIRTEQLQERNQTLKVQERRLTRQNERLEQFASIISHDLRNPLNVANGRLTLAKEESDSEHLAHIERAHDRMDDLIEDILALARDGSDIDDFEPVDLATVLNECWANVETDTATIEVATDRTIVADKRRLKQLLENLIRNAVEHGSTTNRTESGDSVEHGSVDRRTRAAESGYDDNELTVTVGDLADGFYIEDTGRGIPESDRSDIFAAGHSTTANGTGLGLHIVSEVADAHGWEITVTESDTGGARFELTDVSFAEE